VDWQNIILKSNALKNRVLINARNTPAKQFSENKLYLQVFNSLTEINFAPFYYAERQVKPQQHPS
jgi:hypothetical protein